jgi:hypothetical protein
MPTPRKAISNQKGRKSKAQKAQASTAPVPMGKPINKIPAEVAADKVAAEKWANIVEMYKDEGYKPSAGDVEIMARVCLMYSECAKIRVLFNRMLDKAIKTGVADKELKYWDSMLEAKRRLLLSNEDRLMLNPAARMRGFPTQKADDTPEAIKKFNI